MVNQHKNPMIGFNPDDGTLKSWYETRAADFGVTAKSLYERALTEYRLGAKTRLSEEDDSDD
jgi:hypothetical protein